MSASAALQSATRTAPFWGTQNTPRSCIFAACCSASGWKTVTKKPPS